MEPTSTQPRRSRSGRAGLFWCLVMSLLASSLRGAEIPTPQPPSEDAKKAAAAFAGAVAQLDGIAAAGMLLANQDLLIRAATKEDPPELAPKVFLIGVQDSRPVLSGGKEEEAYCELLLLASKVSAKAFAKTARKEVSYPQMFEQPAEYRGEVVHYEGQMLRLRVLDAPDKVREKGLEKMYEAWICDGKTYGAHPLCAIFLDLPAGMQIGDKVNYWVTFDGYFFKKYRYQGGNGWYDAPLLVGRSPVVRKNNMGSVADNVTIPQSMVFWFFGLVAGTVVLVVGLGWWYRRGDRKVRNRLAAARPLEFTDMPADETLEMDWQHPHSP
jgi:hypothetical protein